MEVIVADGTKLSIDRDDEGKTTRLLIYDHGDGAQITIDDTIALAIARELVPDSPEAFAARLNGETVGLQQREIEKLRRLLSQAHEWVPDDMDLYGQITEAIR